MSSTASGYLNYDGDDWETLSLRVLREYHGPDLIPVPDTNGDHGIEAFSLNGNAYQCYAPEGELLPTDIRYRRHRRKLNDDVGKFISNAPAITGFLPPDFQFLRWILIVPLRDNKKILTDCATQAKRIRDATLPHCHSDMMVSVMMITEFEGAHEAVLARTLQTLHLDAPSAVDFSKVDSAQVEVMRDKLLKVPRYATDSAILERVMSDLLSDNLSGRDHRQQLLDQYTELGERLEEGLTDLEARLELSFVATAANPSQLLKDVLEETESRVQEAIPHLTSAQRRALAWGQVAEWLMLCPLDFRVAP